MPPLPLFGAANGLGGVEKDQLAAVNQLLSPVALVHVAVLVVVANDGIVAMSAAATATVNAAKQPDALGRANPLDCAPAGLLPRNGSLI
jgi:hypothetical protein